MEPRSMWSRFFDDGRGPPDKSALVEALVDLICRHIGDEDYELIRNECSADLRQLRIETLVSLYDAWPLNPEEASGDDD